MHENLFENEIDTYIIQSPINRMYFTGFNSSFGIVVLNSKEKLFFTDSRYDNAAKSKLTGFSVITVSHHNANETIRTELEKLGAKSLGFEDKFITVSDYKKFKVDFTDFSLIPCSDILEKTRLIKTPAEIAKIVQAQDIAEKSLKKLIQTIKAGMTEKEIAAELIYECLMNGAEEMSFPTIVAFAENTANPHHFPSNKKLEKNDVILIDFGVKFQGYCCDMTRTFCLNTPKSEIAIIHNIVLEAQNYALRHIKAGMTAHEADSLAREIIKANGYGKEFSHTLGHGVGLEIHEPPSLKEKAGDILLPGMVVTVEPGIYINGLGGVRIEDMVLIKEGGVENLTNFEKKLEL